MNHPRNGPQVLGFLLSDEKESEPELVRELEKIGDIGKQAHPFPSPSLRCPSVQRGGWLGPSQETSLPHLAVLRVLLGNLHPHGSARSGGLCGPSGPFFLCSQLRPPSPFPFSWPQTFVTAPVTCFRKRASLFNPLGVARLGHQ